MNVISMNLWIINDRKFDIQIKRRILKSKISSIFKTWSIRRLPCVDESMNDSNPQNWLNREKMKVPTPDGLNHMYVCLKYHNYIYKITIIIIMTEKG